MSGPLLRLARREDVPGILTVWNAAFGDSEELIRRLLLELGLLEHMAVAEQDGRVAAVMSAFDGLRFGRTSASYLYALGTLPDYRGQGLGRAVLLKAADLAFGRGAELVCLHPASPSLTAWYQSLGFRPGGAEPSRSVPAARDGEISFCSLTAEDYAARRREAAVSVPLSLLRVQALFCSLFGGGLLLAETPEGRFPLCAEFLEDTLLLRELLCPPALRQRIAGAAAAHFGAGNAVLSALPGAQPLLFLGRGPDIRPPREPLPFPLD